MAESRDNQCPKRGPGLTHTQSASQRPDGGCIHCGTIVVKGGGDSVPGFHPSDMRGGHPPIDDEEEQERQTVPSVADRLIAMGLLNRNGTVRHDDLAPDCIVAHDSLRPWAVCSQCGIYHEPRMAEGMLAGAAWGPGRGGLTERLRRRLRFIRWLADRMDH